MEWFNDFVLRPMEYILIGFNIVLVLRNCSLVFKSFLLFLIFGQLANDGMRIAQYITGNHNLVDEIRYIYGLFDITYLLWLATAFGNYKNRKRLSIILPAIAGFIWLLFLLLHYFKILAFPVGAMESSAGIVMSIALGFAILSRIELLEESNPLYSPINLLLISQLLYVFSTIVIFGIAGTAIRDKLYFIHSIIHFMRDLIIISAFILEYRRLKTNF